MNIDFIGILIDFTLLFIGFFIGLVFGFGFLKRGLLGGAEIEFGGQTYTGVLKDKSLSFIKKKPKNYHLSIITSLYLKTVNSERPFLDPQKAEHDRKIELLKELMNREIDDLLKEDMHGFEQYMDYLDANTMGPELFELCLLTHRQAQRERGS
jgi:hypothetical protein